jgi:hypothetical protein
MSLATASALAARRTVTSGSAGSGCVNWPQPRLAGAAGAGLVAAAQRRE